MTGMLEGQTLVNAYHAMDVFAFASTTETQGLVVTEALASGTPVVALDAPAVSEVLNGDDCGRLVPKEDETLFGDTLSDFLNSPLEQRGRASQEARRVSERFSEDNCVQDLSEVYRSVCREGPVWKPHGRHSWEETMRLIKSELNIVGNMTKAVGAAISDANSKKSGVWL
jgi:glycosyltransferase involved in cell wall biosynthesis